MSMLPSSMPSLTPVRPPTVNTSVQFTPEGLSALIEFATREDISPEDTQDLVEHMVQHGGPIDDTVVKDIEDACQESWKDGEKDDDSDSDELVSDEDADADGK